MLSTSDNTLFLTLKQMVRCCQDIQALLEADKDHFIQNHLTLIEESNKKKSELIVKLDVLANELNGRHPDGLMKRIGQNKTDLTSAGHDELASVVEELKAEVNKCYKYISINSNIVFTNLQQLKEMWDKIVVCKPGDVYDHTGSTVR